MRVRHRKFGVGKVANVELGATPKAVVHFSPPWGQKTIALRFLEMA